MRERLQTRNACSSYCSFRFEWEVEGNVVQAAEACLGTSGSVALCAGTFPERVRERENPKTYPLLVDMSGSFVQKPLAFGGAITQSIVQNT